MYSLVENTVRNIRTCRGHHPAENRFNFQQLSRFLSNINSLQTTNRHSYRASLIKSILIEQWFGHGRGVPRDALINSAIDEASYIRRFLGRYMDEKRCHEQRGMLYPTLSSIEHMDMVCGISDMPRGLGLSKIELRIPPIAMRFITEMTRRVSPSDKDLSGQLIRLELVLWEQETHRNCELMNTTEIATQANIRKSTLTTLLNAAVTKKIVTHHVDENDERITRWGLNRSHPRNTQMKSVLMSKFPDMRLSLAR